MNDTRQLPAATAILDAVQSMRSASPSLRRALEVRSYSSGDPIPFDTEWALDLAARNGDEQHVAETRLELQAAMQPADPQWFGKRLPLLWTLFMAARDADARALTVWMAETARLLGDLPHDIVAHSIDQAIKTAKHGFIPSIGEIRSIADPLVVEREMHIARLTKMDEALSDPAACAQRAERRAIQERLKREIYGDEAVRP